MEVMLMCPHVSDAAFCGLKIKNVALSLSLAGHLCSSA